MKADRQKSRAAGRSNTHKLPAEVILKRTDREVFSYLNELCGENGDRTCTVSLPAIADACDISERQAQVSTGRLIKAGLLKRTGYDFGNAVRSRRGTKYRLLKSYAEVHNEIEVGRIESAVRLLLKRQDAMVSLLEHVESKQDKLLSLVTRLAGRGANGQTSNRGSKKRSQGT
jgi:hypothetical protein